MRDIASKIGVVSACGFGLSKAATSIGYLSAMGSVARNIGFVTELWFMLASEAVSLVCAVVVGALAARGRIRPRSIPQWQALLVFLAGFCLSTSGLLAGLPAPVSAGVLGAFYGVSSFLFCVTWLEEFAYQEPRRSHRRMVAGLCVQMLVVALVSLLPPFLLPASAMAAAVVSCLCYFDVMLRGPGALLSGADASERASSSASALARFKRPESPSVAEAFEPVTARAFVAKFGTAFACLFVLVGVVGILHTSVLGSSFEHIVGGVSMWVPLAAATLVTAVAALVALRLPDPTAVYKAVLPVMLVLLSLLPFMGDLLGPFAGAVMIACYDVCGMLFLFFIVDAAHCHKQQSYLLSSVYMGGSNGFLALGLGIGLLLNYLSGDYDISLMTLFAFVAIYPLCIAFVAVMRRNMQGMRRAAQGRRLEPEGAFREGVSAGASASRESSAAASASHGPSADASGASGSEGRGDEASAAPLSPEPDWEGALAAFAARYRLTKRETEICSYLVRGRSAKHIAEELFISENTVWTHTKNVYAKTKVSGKDDLMNLFENEAFGR